MSHLITRTFAALILIEALLTCSYAQQRSVAVDFPTGTPACRVRIQGPGVDTTVASNWSYSFKLGDGVTFTVQADEPAVAVGIGGDISTVDQTTASVTLSSDVTVFPRVTSRDPAVPTDRAVTIPAGWRMLATPFQSGADPFPADHGLEIGHVIMPGGGRFHPNYYAASALRVFYRQGLPPNLSYVGLRLFHSNGSVFTVIGSNILEEGGLAAGAAPDSFGVGSNWSKIPLKIATMAGSVAGPDGSGWLELPLQWPVSDLGIWMSTNDAHDGSTDWTMMILTGPGSSDSVHQPALKLKWNETVAPSTAPVITGGTGDLTLKSGDSAVLTASVSGYPFPTLEWLKDGVVIAGATSSTFPLSAVDPSVAGTYSLRATNTVGTTEVVVSVVTVTPAAAAAAAPTISGIPATLSVTEGDAINLAASVSGTAPITFVWQKDGVPVDGCISAIFSIAAAKVGDSGKYTLLASNSVGSATATVTIAVSVKKPTITADPVSASVVIGGSVTFSVTAKGSGTLTYRWTKDGASVPGVTGPSLIIGTATYADAGTYVAYVGNAGGESNSAPATLNVVPNVVAPVLTESPSAVTVHEGETVTFSAAATGTAPLVWQWWRNSVPITGASSPTLTVPNVSLSNSGDLYRVEVSNSANSVFSDSVQLTVLAGSNTNSTSTGTGSTSTQNGNSNTGGSAGSGSTGSSGASGTTSGGTSGAGSSSSSNSGSSGSTTSTGSTSSGTVTRYYVSFDPGMSFVGYVGSTMMVAGRVTDGSGAPVGLAAVDMLDGSIPYPLGTTDGSGHFSGGVPIPYVLALGLRAGSIRVRGTVAATFYWAVSATDLSAFAGFSVDTDIMVGTTSNADMLAFSTNSGGAATVDDMMQGARKVGIAFVKNASHEAFTYAHSRSAQIVDGVLAILCLSSFVGDEIAGPPACVALVETLTSDAAHAAFRVAANTAIDVSGLSPADAGLAHQMVTAVDAGTSAFSSIGGAFGLARDGGALSVEKLLSPTADAVRTVTDVVQGDAGSVAGYCVTSAYSDGTVRVFTVATTTPQMPSVLRSTSVRAYGGADPIILGFVPRTSSSALIQASGPTLQAYGVADPAMTTSMRVWMNVSATDYTSSTSDWGAIDNAETSINALKLQHSSECGAVINLTACSPGTAVVTANGGEALVEIYPITSAGGFRNLSARAHIDGQHAVHVGFSVRSYADMPLLIRGVGDELVDISGGASIVPASGVSFTVWRIAGSAPTAVTTVNSVTSAATLTASRVLAFPLHSVTSSAADVVHLAPGDYTVEAETRTPGTVLVEIYDAQ